MQRSLAGDPTLRGCAGDGLARIPTCGELHADPCRGVWDPAMVVMGGHFKQQAIDGLLVPICDPGDLCNVKTTWKYSTGSELSARAVTSPALLVFGAVPVLARTRCADGCTPQAATCPPSASDRPRPKTGTGCMPGIGPPPRGSMGAKDISDPSFDSLSLTFTSAFDVERLECFKRAGRVPDRLRGDLRAVVLRDPAERGRKTVPQSVQGGGF